MKKSIFLENLRYFYARTTGEFDFPNSAEGDLLKRAKIEIEELIKQNEQLEREKAQLQLAYNFVSDKLVGER